MSGQFVLLSVCGSIAASLGGLVMSLIFTQDPSVTHKSTQGRQFTYRVEPQNDPRMGMNQVIIAVNGTMAPKVIAIALHSYAATEVLRSALAVIRCATYINNNSLCPKSSNDSTEAAMPSNVRYGSRVHRWVLPIVSRSV